MNNPHISTFAGKYLVVMDITGSLSVLGKDWQWHNVFCPCGVEPYRFDGSEVVTYDCLPSWGVDAYYTENLPESLQVSSVKH